MTKGQQTTKKWEEKENNVDTDKHNSWAIKLTLGNKSNIIDLNWPIYSNFYPHS